MADDWLNKWKGATEAKAAGRSIESAPTTGNPIEGFLNSGLSSVAELFGQNPTQEAATFRAENPIAGIASELIATAVPYGGVFKLSQGAKAAGLLEKAVAKVVPRAAEQTFRAGVAREAIRYAPFEVARLGVGLATAPSDNWGDLLADVALSTALTGAVGGIGGFLKAGGRLASEAGRVVGANPDWADTFKLRLLRSPTGEATGTAGKELVEQDLINNVLKETATANVASGQRARYVVSMDGGTPAGDELVNSLFRVRGDKNAKVSGIDKRMLFEGEASDRLSLDAGEQAQVLGAMGMQDIGELASTLRYPRQVSVKSRRAAGALAQAIEENPSLQMVGDGVWLGRQADSGLFVGIKRIKAAEPKVTNYTSTRTKIVPAAEGELPTPEVITSQRTRTTKPKQFGTGRIAEGDKYIVALTDKPQVFAGDAHKIAESNVAAWGRYREAFQPGLRDDLFNRTQDMVLNNVSVSDWEMLAKQGKKPFVTKMSEKLTGKMGELTGLTNSKTVSDFSNFVADAIVPTMFKEARHPVFGRLYGMLNLSMKAGGEQVSRIIKGQAKFVSSPAASIMGKNEFVSGYKGFEPVSQTLSKLSASERQALVAANRSADVAGNIAKLKDAGRWTPLLDDTVGKLQQLNKTVLAEDILPAFRDSPEEMAKFQLLDGYFMPRKFKGDFYGEVVDEAGRVQYLSSGRTGASVQKEMDEIISEAASRGLNWKAGAEYLKGAKHAVEYERDVMQSINEAVAQQMGKSGETYDIIQRALNKVEAARNPRTRMTQSSGRPAALTNERTGIRGSADTQEYSLDDLVKQIENHYQGLYKYAGHYAWQQRWGSEVAGLGKANKTLHDDLQRKAQQLLGIEGKFTTALNDLLKPALGNTLGSKPATRIAQASNSLMYNWNLAIANPTFAVLNLLQPLQTVMPAIAYLHTAPAAEIAAHYHIAPTFDAAGRATGIGGFLSPIKVMGESVKDLRNPSAELKEIFERATTDGTLQHSQVDEWLGAHSANSSTIRETFAEGGVWKGITKIATIGAEKSEQFSRMISAAAMYRVGKFQFGLEGDALYRFVQRGVHVTNYGYGVVDRSRMFTGPIGSTFGLFKNWQMNYIGQMAQYSGVALKHGTLAPLAWQLGGALALGGIGATPLRTVADGLVKWNTDADSSYQWMQENWHDSADEIFFGLPAFLGVSLQASSTIPGTDVRNEVSSLMSFTFIERMKQVGKALGTAYDVGSAGDFNALRNPNVRDQVLNAIAPRALFRAVSTMEGDYIKSMGTGYPQVRDVGIATRLMHGLGLNALEIERQQVAARELYKDQTTTKAAIQSLGIAYADAMGNGDQDEMTRIIGRATASSLPVSSVMKSAQSRMNREQNSDLFSRFDPAAVGRYKSALGVD